MTGRLDPDRRERLRGLARGLAGRRVLVAGDLMVDRYVFAEPARLSREAPVVIARYGHEELIPGGAANAARNLCRLGAQVSVVGLVGDDGPGRWLKQHLERDGVETGGLRLGDGFATVTKTRFLVGEASRTKQQLFRIDREPDGRPPAAALRDVEADILARLDGVDGTLLSDYGYDVLDEAAVRAVLAAQAGRVLCADSRYRIREFHGVTMATPNEAEVEALVGRRLTDEETLEAAGRELLGALGSDSLLITRGNRGMALFRPDAPRLDIPATGSDEVTDVSGAGDTVIAVATLALAAGASTEDAATLANCAAGVVVMKIGAATCSPAELDAALVRHP